MSDDKLKFSIYNFVRLAYYNGYLEAVNDIYEQLKNPKEYGQVERPRQWRKKENYGIDEFCGIFWSWLVLTFGDYGTSPRFGWIDKENVQYLIEVFEDIKNDLDFTEKDNY